MCTPRQALLRLLRRSKMYSLYKDGESTPPCFTPCLTSWGSLYIPFQRMTSFPPMYMLSTSVHSGRFRLVVNNFDLSSSWFTTSNAFRASSFATISVDFVRLASARASVMTRLAMLGDLPMVKPNCRSFPGRSCSIPSFMQMSSTILHKIGAMVMPRWLSWILGSLSFFGMGILYVLFVMSGSFLSVTIFCISSVSISMHLWGSSLNCPAAVPWWSAALLLFSFRMASSSTSTVTRTYVGSRLLKILMYSTIWALSSLICSGVDNFW